MSLTQEQAKSLLVKAQQRKPDLSREEARLILAEANKRVGASQQVENQVKDGRTGVQKVADFFGLGTGVRNVATISELAGQDGRNRDAGDDSKKAFEMSNALIQQAKVENDPTKKKELVDQAREIMRGSESRMNQFSSDLAQRQTNAGISEKDLERSNLEFALRRGVGQSAELASWLLPGAAVPGKATTVGARIGQAALRGGMSGGLQGVSRAAKDAETVGETLLQTGTGAALGAGTGAAFQLVLETPQIAKEWWNKASKKLGPKAKEIYASTLKENIKDQKFIKQAGGIDKVIDEATANKLPNTKNGMQKYLEQYGPEFDEIVTKELNKAPNKGRTISLTDAKKRAMNMVKKQYGSDQTIVDAAERWFDSNSNIYNGNTSLAGANKLRRGLDKSVGGKLAQDINQGPTAAKKAMATVLRDNFKTAVPELKPAIRKYQLVSGLAEAMKKEPVTGLAEMASAGTGAALGSIYSGPAAILSAIGGLGAGTAARSPGLKRAVAGTVMREARRAAPTVVKSAINANPVVIPAVAALQRMIEKERNAKQSNKLLP